GLRRAPGRRADVVADDAPAGGGEVLRERSAHDAEADYADRSLRPCHSLLPCARVASLRSAFLLWLAAPLVEWRPRFQGRGLSPIVRQKFRREVAFNEGRSCRSRRDGQRARRAPDK